MSAAFPDLLFVKILLTIPVSSASAERSFSTMKRVKSYLRSIMTELRLNSLCMLAIEHEYSHNLLKNPSLVFDAFASIRSRRVPLV